LIVEAAGDPIYGTDLIAQALQAGLPVVTMDAELQITSGTYLSTLGYLAEAEGDQPGALAALYRDAVAMGFKPLVYGNLKGFLNHYPTLEEMKHWANVQGISLTQVTAFTDGTKLQVEQALVANGLGATIAQQGLLGYVTADVNEGSYRLAADAMQIGNQSVITCSLNQARLNCPPECSSPQSTTDDRLLPSNTSRWVMVHITRCCEIITSAISKFPRPFGKRLTARVFYWITATIQRLAWQPSRKYHSNQEQKSLTLWVVLKSGGKRSSSKTCPIICRSV